MAIWQEQEISSQTESNTSWQKTLHQGVKLLLELVSRPLRSEFGMDMATEGLTTSPRSRRWYNISPQISSRDHAQTNEGEDDSEQPLNPQQPVRSSLLTCTLCQMGDGVLHQSIRGASWNSRRREQEKKKKSTEKICSHINTVHFPLNPRDYSILKQNRVLITYAETKTQRITCENIRLQHGRPRYITFISLHHSRSISASISGVIKHKLNKLHGLRVWRLSEHLTTEASRNRTEVTWLSKQRAFIVTHTRYIPTHTHINWCSLAILHGSFYRNWAFHWNNIAIYSVKLFSVLKSSRLIIQIQLFNSYSVLLLL